MSRFVKLITAIVILLPLATGIMASRGNKEIERWQAERQGELAEQHSKYEAGNYIPAPELPNGESINFPGKPAVLFFAELSNLSGVSDVLTMYRFSRFFGDSIDIHWLYSCREEVLKRFEKNYPEIEIDWIFDGGDMLFYELGRSSLILDGNGLVQAQFSAVDEKSIRLYLNKIVEDKSMGNEKKLLVSGMKIEELYLYRKDGTRVLDFTGTLFFLSTFCDACDEWIEDGRIEAMEGDVMVVLDIEEVNSMWDGKLEKMERLEKYDICYLLDGMGYEMSYPMAVTIGE
ncbi:MAG: hypothetical protein KAU17_07095 [Spirochaetales bacterium]|nr:hypothetical protein [Spirochaetales bacterium]